MSSQKKFHQTSNPLNMYFVEKFGLVKGAIASRIVYACGLSDNVCRMGYARIAKELGISKSTVKLNVNNLIEEKYLKVIKKATYKTPYHLKPTKKLEDLLPKDKELYPGGRDAPQGVEMHTPGGRDAHPQGVEMHQDKESLDIEIEEVKKNQPKPKTPPPDEAKKTETELITNAIKEACKIALTKANASQVYKTVRHCKEKEIPPPLIIEFGKWFNTIHWVGKYPNPGQIISEWPKFEDYRKNGTPGEDKNGHVPTTLSEAQAAAYAKIEQERLEEAARIASGN